MKHHVINIFCLNLIVSLILPVLVQGNPSQVEKVQQTFPLAGDWVANVKEYGTYCTIYFSPKKDGTYSTNFNCGGSTNTASGTWKYNDGRLVQYANSGRTVGKGSIKWINKDYFIITIIDNGNPDYKGVKRHYKRVPKEKSPSSQAADIKQKKCSACSGSGRFYCGGCSPNGDILTCTVCAGYGYVSINSKTGAIIPGAANKSHFETPDEAYQSPFNANEVWYQGRFWLKSNLPAGVKIRG